MINKFLIFYLALAATPGIAMQKLSAKEGEVLTAYVSTIGLNRIAITGDRVVGIKGLANQFLLEKDVKLGELYLKPLEGIVEPIHIYISTEKGHTYQLSLLPHERVPENIVITPHQALKPVISQPFEQQIAELIRAMHKRKPTEVLEKRYNLKTEKRHWVNQTSKIITLQPHDFYAQEVKAICIVTKTLHPQQGSDIYIIKSSGKAHG